MRDEQFIRGAIPMTKSEVRAVSLSKLELESASIVYDIGAGTGSVSVEAARLVPGGHVYAFEREDEGCRLILANAEKFKINNLTVVRGSAPESLEGAPKPDCVFVGGTGGKFREILDAVFEKNPLVRVVINVISLESLTDAIGYFKGHELEPEVICVQVSRANLRGRHHMMQALNPIYVLSAGGVPENDRQRETADVQRMQQKETDAAAIPRILIAAPCSGSGKTVITAGLLTLFQRRGMSCVSFKCGPDYIDSMFHRYVLGAPGCNLDSFFLGREQVMELFAEKSRGLDMAVMEGAMGYYDGVGGNTLQASSYEIAEITKTPVILVVDAKSSSLSVAAQVKGFLEYQTDSRIMGVILNRASKESERRLRSKLEELGVACLGAVPVCREAELTDRHLGLTIPEKQEQLCQRLEKMADKLEECLSVERILEIAREAGPLPEETKCERELVKSDAPRRRMGVARDEAFCFYYQENLEFLQENGWDLVEFSPLLDSRLPENLDGILLGGGYPECYADKLSRNTSMLADIREAAASGVKILAECGGFLYLHRSLEDMEGQPFPMAGVIDGDGFRTERLSRFGYIELTQNDQKLPYGIRGHEFHYWDSTNPGTAMGARKPSSSRRWDCMHRTETILAGFPHLYYRSAPGWILQFLNGGQRS